MVVVGGVRLSWWCGQWSKGLGTAQHNGLFFYEPGETVDSIFSEVPIVG
jgi:hypothetical protein